MDKLDEQTAQRAYLKAVLAKTGWDPTTLARKAGVVPSTINRFLGGKNVVHSLKAQTLVAVSKVSGVPLPLGLIAAGSDVPPQAGVVEGEHVVVFVKGVSAGGDVGKVGLAEPERTKFEAKSIQLDRNVLINLLEDYFGMLDRRRPDWTPRERAEEFMATYARILVERPD